MKAIKSFFNRLVATCIPPIVFDLSDLDLHDVDL